MEHAKHYVRLNRLIVEPFARTAHNINKTHQKMIFIKRLSKLAAVRPCTVRGHGQCFDQC
jgi:hypothetical protein